MKEAVIVVAHAEQHFIHQGRRDYRPPRQSVVLGRPVHLASRRKSREDCGPSIQQVALELLLCRPHRAEEDIVVAVDGVVDPQDIARPTYGGRGTPQEARLV